MRVLVVCSGNSGQVSPFITEQVQQIKKSGTEIRIFSIIGKGLLGKKVGDVAEIQAPNGKIVFQIDNIAI